MLQTKIEWINYTTWSTHPQIGIFSILEAKVSCPLKSGKSPCPGCQHNIQEEKNHLVTKLCALSPVPHLNSRGQCFLLCTAVLWTMCCSDILNAFSRLFPKLDTTGDEKLSSDCWLSWKWSWSSGKKKVFICVLKWRRSSVWGDQVKFMNKSHREIIRGGLYNS